MANTSSTTSFGEKIRSLRISKGWTQARLAEEVTKRKKTSGGQIHATAVSAWENQDRLPFPSTRLILAELFDVPVSYLFEEMPRVERKEEKGLMELTSAIEIYLYDGEPLYVHHTKMEKLDGWVLVDGVNKELVDIQGKRTKIDKINFLTTKIFTADPYKSSLRLPLQAAKKLDRVFVVPTTTDRQAKALLTGWYKYYKSQHLFLRINGGNALSEGEYGVTYFAYSDIPLPEHDEKKKR